MSLKVVRVVQGEEGGAGCILLRLREEQVVSMVKVIPSSEHDRKW